MHTRGREYVLLSPWLESDGCVWRRMENSGFYGFEAVTEMALEAKIPYCGISNLLAHALSYRPKPQRIATRRDSPRRGGQVIVVVVEALKLGAGEKVGGADE